MTDHEDYAKQDGAQGLELVFRLRNLHTKLHRLDSEIAELQAERQEVILAAGITESRIAREWSGREAV